MSAQYQQSISADGVRTYIDREGNTVQESGGPVPIYRGLAAAGGDGFRSESESDSEEDYHHHHHAPNYIPQSTSEKKAKKEKKDKKSKKSKKDRSGSSSSGHACSCSHSH